MDCEFKLSVFQEFLDCSGVMLWHYDGAMKLLSGGDPDNVFETLLQIGGSRELILRYCQTNSLPGFCSDGASLLWLAAPRCVSEVLTDIYVIGPVFGSVSSEKTLITALQQLKVPDSVIRDASNIIKLIPTVQHTLLVQYGVMLYRCITDIKLDAADLQLITSTGGQEKLTALAGEDAVPYGGVYALERQVFQAVEDGNIHYQHPKELFSRKIGVLAVGNPLRHAKNQIIICITLITRAAIRGGMPEESAYSLSDWYIQMLEASNDIAEVYQYSQDAFQDFTQRVHKCKLSRRSKEIQECMSYIELHFQEKLNMDVLAKELGYSKNHLSSKFSREVGISISDYVTQVRIERAKLWLKNSDKSILDISNELNYSSISYFSAVFKKQTGASPSEFRNKT